ncbi:alanine racemase [Clostridium sp. MB40-C1]|uniref:alanine racemase n=1 Tax=Clostridium sp. MB40-C1 TaxID=3070996 RepID=UPI0027DF6B05|nr:alanine racemase [Clostridium sp. MB40-C1]WMJ80245.1 alanine racemase [Clostridium sp. MB40-C1]
MNLWCDIDKNLLNENIKRIKELTNKPLISVVKSNGYGLGIKNVSKAIEENIDVFAVASLEEAKALDTNKDILIMTPVCTLSEIHRNNYIYTVDSTNDIDLFNGDITYRVHIYIDTGMNRLGLSYSEVYKIIKKIKEEKNNIIIEGIYTHLHNTNNIKKTMRQIDILKELYNSMPEIKHWHCLNSKGILIEKLREYASWTTMVRAGNILYGYDGISHGFKKVFNIKAKVVKEYFIKENGYIGYGSKFKIKKGTRVGIIECGIINKFGCTLEIKNSFIINILKAIKKSFKPHNNVFYNKIALELLCTPNMNCSIISLDKIGYEIRNNIVVEIPISPILLDSSIPRILNEN